MKIYVYTSKDTQTSAGLDKDISKALILCKEYLEVLDMVRQITGVWYKKGRSMEKIRFFIYVLPPLLLLLLTAQLAFFLLLLSRKVIPPFLIFLSEGLSLVPPKSQGQKLQ